LAIFLQQVHRPILSLAVEGKTAPSALLKTILIVDDSRFQGTANRRFLEKAGYRVVLAADGLEALKVACCTIPDLILLDMLLPKMTGPDVLKALKADHSTTNIPVIVFSGLVQKNEIKLMQDGASAYYQKSRMDQNNGEELLELIRSVLHENPVV
jgi:chemosensory pili system protein ChpA (sensor histidine kinase/response regulator)